MSIVRYAGKKLIRQYAADFMKRILVTNTASNASISEKNFNGAYTKIFQKKSENSAKKKRLGSESQAPCRSNKITYINYSVWHGKSQEKKGRGRLFETLIFLLF